MALLVIGAAVQKPRPLQLQKIRRKDMKMRFRAFIPALLAAVASMALSRQADAQASLTVGAGLGTVLNDRTELPTNMDDVSHKLAFLSLHVPVLPIGVRGEAMWPSAPFADGSRAYIVSAVLSLPLPLVTPYAQAGWGDYNFGDPEREKWSAGIGARLNFGTLGIFAEATRYNRIDTDLITAGLTLSTGK
jgi:hypothetical protein